jgi:hypothetical protein
MGPGPPKQKGDKSGSKNASQRALTTAGQGSSYAGSTAMSTDPGSSPTAVTDGSRLSGEGWNLKRYQREDEALWGLDFHGPGQRIKDAIARAGSSAGRLLEGRLSKSGPSEREEENPPTYYLARNPPVNDLHPPVVSTQPTSRDETRWMLQPPPPAKVMEGKERVNRSRAGSNGSSRKGGDGSPLSRQVTERLVDAKLQRGETPYLEVRSEVSRAGSRSKTPTSSRSNGQRHDRSRSPSCESSGASDGAAIKRKRKPPQISISPSAMSSRDTIEHIPTPSNHPLKAGESEMRERPARPMLTTIVSSSNVVPQASPANDGLLALRELSPSSSNSALNSRVPSPSQRLLSPNANAMPASIPSLESKFPGAQTYRFPRPMSMENEDPAEHTA